MTYPEHQSPIANPQSLVAVIGAGISGLCVAYWLKKHGFNVVVLERDAEVGGTMKTVREDGWLIETGPNSALETTPLFQQLFTELHISDQLLYANKAASLRYIVRRGLLTPVPTGAVSFLSTPLWSVNGKMRLLKEPFVGRANREESIAEFVRRRLGKELLDYAVNPFVAGVYAGDPEKLSVQSALPKLFALEEKYGGLMKGALMSRRERKKRNEVAKDRTKLFSFKDGMKTLPSAFAGALGESVRLECTVEHIIPMRAGRYPIYTISYTQGGIRETVQAAAVVLAAPAYAAASIVRAIDPDMASTLESIYYPPVAEVFMGFRTDQIGRALDGFGFLVPEVERRKILGSIWSSTLFPGRAADGQVGLTTFVGGARQPELMGNDDEQMTSLVLSELSALMKIQGAPIFTRIVRWDRAIPQYNLGYHKVLHAIDRFEDNFRGAFICANYRGGISVGDCVMSAHLTVSKLEEHLGVVRS